MNRILVIFLTLLYPFFCHSVNFEFWQVFHFNKEISEKWTFTLRTEERWQEVYSNLIRHQHDIGLLYKLNDCWNYHLFYRYKVIDSHTGWNTEHESLLDIRRIWELTPFTIEDRNRFDYSFYDHDWFYRNRISLIKPIGNFNGNLELFISNEFFFLNFQEYQRNRLAAGFGYFPLNRINRIRGLFIIQYQNNDQIGWTHTKNIVELEFRFNF